MRLIMDLIVLRLFKKLRQSPKVSPFFVNLVADLMIYQLFSSRAPVLTRWLTQQAERAVCTPNQGTDSMSHYACVLADPSAALLYFVPDTFCGS